MNDRYAAVSEPATRPKSPPEERRPRAASLAVLPNLMKCPLRWRRHISHLRPSPHKHRQRFNPPRLLRTPAKIKLLKETDQLIQKRALHPPRPASINKPL